MSIFSDAAASANVRHQDQIARAKKSKKGDSPRILHQTNVPYADRLVRASLLNTTPQTPNHDVFKALVASCPEVLLFKGFKLGWGEAREQKNPITSAPKLLQHYASVLEQSDPFSVSEPGSLPNDIQVKSLATTLLCHGLSPTPDSIFLLADIGRAARVANSIGLPLIRIMLADISWMRYNRSLLKHFGGEDEYIDRLRICQDKRRRLYDALNIKYDIFSISAFGNKAKDIDEVRLASASKIYIDLARSIWGEQVCSPHDARLQKLIGQPLYGLSEASYGALPKHMQSLLKFESLAKSLESEMKGELNILRSMSLLFSTFDDDIFVYYFAQFFAQKDYDQFLKIAVASEGKFDSYFDQHFDDFENFGRPSKKIIASPKKTAKSNRRYVYFPQYSLCGVNVLPYSSLSLDVVKNEGGWKQSIENIILLDDCSHDDIAYTKIVRILKASSLFEINRLFSDLLSFSHLLHETIDGKFANAGNFEQSLRDFCPDAANEIFSEDQTLALYQGMFSNWISSIDKPDSIVPFHLQPYMWDEAVWDDNRFHAGANFVLELLRTVRHICS